MLSLVAWLSSAPGQPGAMPQRPPGGPAIMVVVRASTPTYVAPKADGAVAALLDEDTEGLFPLLNNASGETGTIVREERDVFAGVEAVRVTPMQKYQAHLPGWAFKIVEAPKVAGEYRFVRFAWKKFGGSGVMVQLHDADKQGWGLRYFAGGNATGWEAKSVAGKMPAQWLVVTRDLFNEFGATSITGIAFTAMDGEAALFDHILLGRSVADLDTATEEALGRTKPLAPLQGKERDALWVDLCGSDRKKAASALRAFLASAPDHVRYIRDRLPRPDSAVTSRVLKLIADFGADAFDTRQDATEEIVKIGLPALSAVREAAKSNDPEVQYRASLVLKRLGDGVQGGAQEARLVRVLERAATPAARELLTKLAGGELGLQFSADAKAALVRLAPK